MKTLLYKFATPEGNGEANVEYQRSSTQGEKKNKTNQHLYIFKQTPSIHYIKSRQSTDYAMLTSGSRDDFSMHPQICTFATAWGLIIKELAVARKAQQKKLAKNINGFCPCKGGFGKGKELYEQGALSSHSRGVFTPLQVRNSKCGIGNSTLHRLRG